MKVFPFEGRGIYSFAYDYDSGLDATLGSEVTLDQAHEYVSQLADKMQVINCLPTQMLVPGIYVAYYQVDGGNRVAIGHVIAKSKAHAERMLGQYITEIINTNESKKRTSNNLSSQ